MTDSALMNKIRSSFTTSNVSTSATSSTPLDIVEKKVVAKNLVSPNQAAQQVSAAQQQPTIQPNQAAQQQPAIQPDPAAQQQPAIQPDPAMTPDPFTTTEKLEVLDQVIGEVEAQSASAQSTTSFQPNNYYSQPDSTLNPTQPDSTLNPTQFTAGSIKESTAVASPEVSPIEAAAGVQSVEEEVVPEIPIEVENFLQEVENNDRQTPPEISIADGTTNARIMKNTSKKPVIVLPITPEVEKEGVKKPPVWSVRWLVEWSRKIMKMFSGSVVYKQAES